MLQNVDSLLSILVSVVTLIGFIAVLFRRPPRQQQAAVPMTKTAMARDNLRKSRGSGGTVLMLTLVALAGIAAWWFVAVPNDRIYDRWRPERDTRSFDRSSTFDNFGTRDSRDTRDRRDRDSRFRP